MLGGPAPSPTSVCVGHGARSPLRAVGLGNSPRLTGEDALGALSSWEGTESSYLRELDAVAKPQA